MAAWIVPAPLTFHLPTFFCIPQFAAQQIIDTFDMRTIFLTHALPRLLSTVRIARMPDYSHYTLF